MVRAICGCGGCGTTQAIEIGRCDDCGGEFCEQCLSTCGGVQACPDCRSQRADDERAVAADLEQLAAMHAAAGVNSLADVEAFNAGLLIGA